MSKSFTEYTKNSILLDIDLLVSTIETRLLPSFDIETLEGEAIWSRFHLENKVRLIGFAIPNEYKDTIHQKINKRFNTNTFYVVFLDKEHRFYKVEK